MKGGGFGGDSLSESGAGVAMVDSSLLFVYKRIGDRIAFMGVRVFVYREEGATKSNARRWR